jgi:hypothetical protein
MIDYICILDNKLSERKKINPSYSMRAFAKSIDLPPSSLSRILLRKRTLPLDRAMRICDTLELNNSERKIFINSLIGSSSVISLKSEKLQLDDKIHTKVIEDWRYSFLLTLFQLSTFKSDIEWMAMKMGESTNEIYQILDDLKRVGLITYSDGQFSWVESTRTTNEVYSSVIQNAHRNHLKVASELISKVDISKRSYRYITLPANPKKIGIVKDKIEHMIQEVESILDQGDVTEIYRFGIQLFPLSKDN